MIEQIERSRLPAYQRYVPEVEAPTPKRDLDVACVIANLKETVASVILYAPIGELNKVAEFLQTEAERVYRVDMAFKSLGGASESHRQPAGTISTLGPWNDRPHAPR